MKIKKQILSIIIFVLLTSLAVAQPDVRAYDEEKIGMPRFNLDGMTFLSENPLKTRVIIYVEIMHDNLQFVQSTRGFEAEYEVDLSVLAGKDISAPRYSSAVWRTKVLSAEYEETNSRSIYDVSDTAFDLPPGEYYLVATLTDLESKRQSEEKTLIRVPNYTLSNLQFGEILLAKDIRLATDDYFEIVPNADRIIRNVKQPLFVYYEIYPYEADELDIYYRVLNDQGNIVNETTFKSAVVKPITRDYFPLDISNYHHGHYVVEVQVSANGQKAMQSANFKVLLAGLPKTVNDLDEAIRQARYITGGKELRVMLDSKPSRKEKLFRDFWKNLDPSPGTPTNEKMEEYYRRVHHANEMFGSFREGWETDMGEVYIRFGPPSDIERHPFDINQKPYEIWRYYDLKRQFVFVDEMGFGEYRLVTNLWR
ncbi:GWxTD domain-containing protein [bacterium]|nr:GWxTD domain-containing protein [bacterium]